MTILRRLLAPALLIFGTQPVLAENEPFEFRGIDPAMTAEPTQVLVLGTTHLSAMRDDFKPEMLDPLIERLVAFAPDAITLETMPGETCAIIRLYPEEYPGTAKSYCTDPAPYQAESGFDAAAAAAHARTELGQWPDSPSPAQRRRLAAAFLAEGNMSSALVQWLRLPESERTEADGIGPKSKQFLERLKVSANENTQIGVRLALLLGHEQVFPADDHSADRIFNAENKAVWDRMREIWNGPPEVDYSGYDRADAALLAGDSLEAYRIYNDPELLRITLDGDFRKAMNDTKPGQYGRRYLAWYQARNLRMVSWIIGVSGKYPGGKILTIVGSSHKPYFDAYLEPMHDIAVVDVAEILADAPLENSD